MHAGCDHQNIIQSNWSCPGSAMGWRGSGRASPAVRIGKRFQIGVITRLDAGRRRQARAMRPIAGWADRPAGSNEVRFSHAVPSVTRLRSPAGVPLNAGIHEEER